MAREAFKNTYFGEDNKLVLAKANRVIADHLRQGFRLTLRQLYYQMIARDLFPAAWTDTRTGTKNNVHSYKRFADILNRGRLGGYVDWAAIEDRTRTHLIPTHWRKPGELVNAVAGTYRLNLWKGQEWHVEVYIEKAALEGVVAPVCSDLDVGFSADRGYSSSSTLYEAGKRLARKAAAGKRLMVFYLGDHDPSGMDMTRDVADRLALFSRAKVEVRRLALNMDQVSQYNPPRNPAKLTDSRAKDYIARYGRSSWELDALEPQVLRDMVAINIQSVLDRDLYDARLKQQSEHRRQLRLLAQNWERVLATMKEAQ